MTRALLTLNGKFDRERAARWIEQSPAGTRIEFKAQKRTGAQNDRMWAMLTDVSTQKKHAGRTYTPDQWKILFMHACGREVQFIPALDNSTFIPWGQSSSDLSKEEMTNLIEFMFAWGAENEVVFHDPQDSNSSLTESPQTEGTDAPATEVSPLPEVAGVSNSLPQGWEIRLRDALTRTPQKDGLVHSAKQCFAKLGAVPTDSRDIDTAKAIRKAFEDNWGDAPALNDALRELV